ncbi:MAG TPA: GNAT family N-acetyltransferase [Burkholderiaceae bacterium]|jgi:putative acetyltransferase
MPDFHIRRALPSDAPGFVQMMSEPEVFGGLLQLPYPTEELWRQRLAEHAAPGKSDLHLVAVRGAELLGSAGLHPAGASLRRRHAMGMGISVCKGEQGKGIGSALMAALLDYADNWGQVLRVELTVYTDNAQAIRLYERFGFTSEGVLRSYALRAGQYVDVLSMARLHPSPPSLA